MGRWELLRRQVLVRDDGLVSIKQLLMGESLCVGDWVMVGSV